MAIHVNKRPASGGWHVGLRAVPDALDGHFTVGDSTIATGFCACPSRIWCLHLTQESRTRLPIVWAIFYSLNCITSMGCFSTFSICIALPIVAIRKPLRLPMSSSLGWFILQETSELQSIFTLKGQGSAAILGCRKRFAGREEQDRRFDLTEVVADSSVHDT